MPLPKIPKTASSIGKISSQKVSMGQVLKSAAKSYLKSKKDAAIESLKEKVSSSLPVRAYKKTASIITSPVRAYKAIGKSYRRAKLAAQEELEAKKNKSKPEPKLLSKGQKEKFLRDFFIETGSFGTDYSTGETVQTPDDYDYYQIGDKYYAVNKNDEAGKAELLGIDSNVAQSPTKKSAAKSKNPKLAAGATTAGIEKIDPDNIPVKSSARGGKRENAGRPKGSKNKEKAIKEFASVIGIDSKILKNIENNTQTTNALLGRMSKASTNNDDLLGVNKKLLDETDKISKTLEQTRQNDLEDQNLSLEDHEIQKQILEATKLAGSDKPIAEQAKEASDNSGIMSLLTFLGPLMPYIAGIAAGIAAIWKLVEAWQGNVNDAEKQYREVGNEGFNVGNTDILGDGEGGRPTDKNLKDSFRGNINDFTGSDRKRLLLMNDPEINKTLDDSEKQEQAKLIEQQQKNPDKWLAPDGTLNVSDKNVQATANDRKNKVDSASADMHKDSVELKNNETAKQPIIVDAKSNNVNNAGGSKDVYDQKLFSTRNPNDSYTKKMMNDSNYPTNR